MLAFADTNLYKFVDEYQNFKYMTFYLFVACWMTNFVILYHIHILNTKFSI